MPRRRAKIDKKKMINELLFGLFGAFVLTPALMWGFYQVILARLAMQ